MIAFARRQNPATADVYLAAADSADRTMCDFGLMVLAAEGQRPG